MYAYIIMAVLTIGSCKTMKFFINDFIYKITKKKKTKWMS